MRTLRRVGRYTLHGLIGAGGFADVYRAFDETLDAAVAIKVLRERWSNDDAVRARFLREARLLRRVDDAHVIDVFDVGELEDGRPYLVMPIANGGTLGDRFADRRHSVGHGDAAELHVETSASELGLLVSSMASGLRAIHASSLVHRDISPANLLVDMVDAPNDGCAPGAALLAENELLVIGDLGLAVDPDGRTGLSVEGGTALFAAPEQVTGFGRVDARADIYAATAVVFEALTTDSPPHPHELEAALALLPRAWRPWFRTGLAVDPDERFADVSAWETAALGLMLASEMVPVAVSRWARDRCPFLGLAAFTAQDAENFFGRERMGDELLEMASTSTGVLVGGPSGSGKSSLVHAGVLHRLCSALGSSIADVVSITPGEAPCVVLADALAAVGASAVPPVVVIDQFEELFSQGASTKDAAEFVAQIERLAGDGSKVIITLRADFYPNAARYPFLAELIRRHFFVGPMTRSELRQSLTQAAHLGGLRLESNLAEAVLEDAGDEPGALPLLSHAMEQTWLARTDDRLQLATYLSIGGVSGALARTAEEVYESLTLAEKKVATSLWLALVSVTGGSTPVVRRRVRRSDLDTEQLAVLEHLVGARLVVSGDAAVELAHEAIIHAWPRLARWLDEERAALGERDRLSSAAEAWVAADCDPDLLLRGAALDRALEWVDSGRVEPAAHVDDFVQQSRERSRRRLALRRGVVIVMGLLAVAAVVGAVGATLGQQRATLARTEAEEARGTLLSDRLAQIAMSGDHDKDVSVGLALEAAAHADTPAAMQALGGLVMQTAGRRLSTVDLDARGVEVLWSPDGAWIATGEVGGVIRLAESRARTPLATLVHPGGGVPAMALSDGGGLLAVGGADGTVHVWRTDDVAGEAPEVVTSLTHADGAAVGTVAFSPDGSTLAAGSADGAVNVWQTGTWELVGAASHDKTVWSLAYTPDSEAVVSASSDGHVRLWSARGAELLVDIDVGRPVWDVAVSPDGKYVAIGSDGAAIVKTIDGGAVAEFHNRCAECSVWAVDFDHTSRFVGSGGSDRSARIFDIDAGEETTYISHGREVVFVDFHPSLSQLLSSSKDRTAKVTFFEGPRAAVVATVTHQDWAWRARWSPDGRLLATVSSDLTAAVWEADFYPLDQTTVPTVGYKEALEATFVGDNIAVSTLTGAIRLIDVRTGRETAALPHDAGILSIAGDDQRESLLVGLDDGRALVWRLADAEVSEELLVDVSEGRPVDERTPAFEVAVVGRNRDRYAVANGDRVFLFDADSLAPAGEFPHPTVHLLKALPSGGLLSVGFDGTFHEWSLETDSTSPSRSYDVGADISAVAVGPTSEVIAVVSRAGVSAFSRHDGKQLPTPEITAVRAVTVVDGTIEGQARTLIIAGGADTDVVAWDAGSGEIVWRHTFGDRVDELHQLEDGASVVAFGNGEHMLHVLGAQSGDVILRRRSTVVGSSRGAVPSDGRGFVAIGESGAVVRFASPSLWASTACGLDRRTLSDADRTALIGVSAPPIDPCGAP